MPRLIALLPLAGLAACHGAPPGHAEAKALIAAHCSACHQVPGIGNARGQVGPPLAGIATRAVIAGKLKNSPVNMRRFLLHPQAALPGGAMPELGLTPAQANAISDYLYALDSK